LKNEEGIGCNNWKQTVHLVGPVVLIYCDAWLTEH
jgi:hypothetical protein